jgi:hypothetical protein
VAPAVSSRSVAAEVPVQSYASSCRLRAGQCGNGAGFIVSTAVFLYQYHSTIAPYSFMHLSPTLILLMIRRCHQVTRLKPDYHK